MGRKAPPHPHHEIVGEHDERRNAFDEYLCAQPGISGLIHSACGLSCWCFSVTGEKLFFSTCPDEQEFLLFLRSSGCLDYATGEQVRRDRPVILSDSIGIIWGAEYMWKTARRKS